MGVEEKLSAEEIQQFAEKHNLEEHEETELLGIIKAYKNARYAIELYEGIITTGVEYDIARNMVVLAATKKEDKQTLIEIAKEASNYREEYGYDYTPIRAAQKTENGKKLMENVIPKMFEWVNGYEELGEILGFLLGVPKTEMILAEADLNEEQRYDAARKGSERFQTIRLYEEKEN